MNRYEAYKDSGVEWIGVIPEGWQLRRISAFYDSRNERVSDKDHPPLSVTMQGVVPQLETAAKTQDGDNRKLVRCGDFVINSRSDRRGACGISAYDGSVTLISNVLAPKDQNEMSTRYYSYLFRSEGFADEFYRQGTGIVDDLWSTNWSRMKNILVARPPLAEQECIADYLDAKTAEIDALVADCDREVELLQEYRKAVISEAVTKGLDPAAPMKDSGIDWIGEIPDDWEVVGFKTYLNGIVDYRGRTPEKVDDGVFLITGRNIKQGRIHYELSQEYMRPDDFDTIMSRGRLKVGNVLFTMEAPLGEVALIDRDDCAAAQRIIQLCCNEDELFGAFLVYWIMSDEFQSDLQTYATGSTASGIKASKLGMLRLMHPPMETQHSIVDFLDAKTAEIDSLIEAKQHMADKLREYRRSLISEAVTGKFKVPGVK